MVKWLLHAEGLVLLGLAVFFYQTLEGNWWLFFLLLFTPDIAMLGYLKDKKLGASLYNLMHNYVLGFALMAVGYFLFPNTFIVYAGIILIAHVGLDRALGYGLKYPTNFKDTHLQKV